MTRNEALDRLRSASTHQRLKASRFLARNSVSEDLETLRAARANETDFYVKGSLDRAIVRLTDAASPTNENVNAGQDLSEQAMRQVYARATEWVAGMLLHELASPLGLLAFVASREVEDYENSRTKGHLETLQTVFSAIEQLRSASATPMPEEFDLAESIERLVATEFSESAIQINTHGPKPLVINSDAALLRFAICNGLRNAVEAVSALGATGPEAIVTTWGENDVEYWVAILDRGAGLSGPVEAVFEIGKTTRKGHSGFGLPIARAAIEALGGTVGLHPAIGGGTRYELRWEKWPRVS